MFGAVMEWEEVVSEQPVGKNPRVDHSLQVSLTSTSIKNWSLGECGFAAVVTTPLDVAKTRIMLAKAGSRNASGNVLTALGGIWRTQGLSGLFAGVVPRMAAISLGGFIFLGTYEKTRQLLL
ncbi:hypothetical protein BTVI_95101 [Pitangus sulphuratus]|nr:hypothetical protein BTVI_95101 [Pitangus sulphuratus]